MAQKQSSKLRNARNGSRKKPARLAKHGLKRNVLISQTNLIKMPRIHSSNSMRQRQTQMTTRSHILIGNTMTRNSIYTMDMVVIKEKD